MSETLREEKGDDQVAEECGAQDETHEVVGAHNRSTPFTMSRARAKKMAVSAR
jgi:hypothetical protein